MQRVAIGRALVRRPAIYLMDEPLSSLDAKLRAELRLELKRIQQDLGATILYVTHDQIEAMTMADRIGVLEPGRLVQIGTPREIYEDPATTYVATRLGQPAINLFPRALFPDLPAPAGAAHDRRAHRAPAHRRATNGVERAGRRCVLDRASRRPEPPASEVGERKLVTLADPDAGSPSATRSRSSLRSRSSSTRRAARSEHEERHGRRGARTTGASAAH